MDPFDRFKAAVARPDPLVPLDEVALCLAAQAEPTLDVDAYLRRLEVLAAACPEPTFDGLVQHLFASGRFAGNATDYGDPRNSFLSDLLDRGVGLPITLSVLAIEVGARAGVPVLGIGMPGHFLVRSGTDPDAFADPFHGGRRLDPAGCEDVFRAVAGPSAPWDAGYLAPVARLAIVARMLRNLQGAYAQRNDLGSLRWVLGLRSALPGATHAEHDEARRLLAPLN
jgi:regulator of sirC expression with transglutaminase-like and TPR domain